jgi:hypothetical protein
MGRRLKTQAELHADLKVFEVAWKREMAQFMRNAVERMITPGSGRRMPAKYKMKLPRFTTTVLEPSLNLAVADAIPRRRTRQKPPPRPGENRRIGTAENLESRQLLANSVERKTLADATALARVRSFQDWHAQQVRNYSNVLGGGKPHPTDRALADEALKTSRNHVRKISGHQCQSCELEFESIPGSHTFSSKRLSPVVNGEHAETTQLRRFERPWESPF